MFPQIFLFICGMVLCFVGVLGIFYSAFPPRRRSKAAVLPWALIFLVGALLCIKCPV